MKLFTIGYERAGFLPFAQALLDAGVRTVIDVRDLPLSRRAGFSKRTLAASLAGRDVAYTHLKALGTPKEGRIANKQRRWTDFWSIVETQLATPAAQDAFEHAAKLASAQPCCLLCFEADPHVCHRLRVADELAKRYGFEVEHLVLEPAVSLV